MCLLYKERKPLSGRAIVYGSYGLDTKNYGYDYAG